MTGCFREVNTAIAYYFKNSDWDLNSGHNFISMCTQTLYPLYYRDMILKVLAYNV